MAFAVIKRRGMEEVNPPQLFTNDGNVLVMPSTQMNNVYPAVGLPQEGYNYPGYPANSTAVGLPQEGYNYPGYPANSTAVGLPQEGYNYPDNVNSPAVGLPQEGYGGSPANPPAFPSVTDIKQ